MYLWLTWTGSLFPADWQISMHWAGAERAKGLAGIAASLMDAQATITVLVPTNAAFASIPPERCFFPLSLDVGL